MISVVADPKKLVRPRGCNVSDETKVELVDRADPDDREDIDYLWGQVEKFDIWKDKTKETEAPQPLQLQLPSPPDAGLIQDGSHEDRQVCETGDGDESSASQADNGFIDLDVAKSDPTSHRLVAHGDNSDTFLSDSGSLGLDVAKSHPPSHWLAVHGDNSDTFPSDSGSLGLDVATMPQMPPHHTSLEPSHAVAEGFMSLGYVLPHGAASGVCIMRGQYHVHAAPSQPQLPSSPEMHSPPGSQTSPDPSCFKSETSTTSGGIRRPPIYATALSPEAPSWRQICDSYGIKPPMGGSGSGMALPEQSPGLWLDPRPTVDANMRMGSHINTGIPYHADEPRAWAPYEAGGFAGPDHYRHNGHDGHADLTSPFHDLEDGSGTSGCRSFGVHQLSDSPPQIYGQYLADDATKSELSN